VVGDAEFGALGGDVGEEAEAVVVVAGGGGKRGRDEVVDDIMSGLKGT